MQYYNDVCDMGKYLLDSLRPFESAMDRLTSDQAQALFSAGGFLILTDLPESSEFGIDGT
jgi:hypothetical protein